MIYRKGGRWALCPYVVTYRESGKEKEKHINDKSWWELTAEKHEHLEIIKFEDAEYSDKEKQRMKEAERVPAEFRSVAENYVKHGKFPNQLEDEEQREDHPLRTLQLIKENQEQGQSLTDTELESMSHGQELTELDLRILELEAE